MYDMEHTVRTIDELRMLNIRISRCEINPIFAAWNIEPLNNARLLTVAN